MLVVLAIIAIVIIDVKFIINVIIAITKSNLIEPFLSWHIGNH